jgi:hypothetical protein
MREDLGLIASPMTQTMWETLASAVRGTSSPDLDKLESLVGEGMEVARDEVEPLLCELLRDEAYPEPAREVMLALMDFECAISAQVGQAAVRWLTHEDRSIFTVALKVALRGGQLWTTMRPMVSEDRQRIGDKIAERF